MGCTLKRFIVNNLGKKVDFDGKFGYQCVDLARQYIKDVLEKKQPPAVEGAKDLWDNPGELKKATDSFAVGDILIYDKTSTNKYGHVCILVSLLDTNTFVVFEQNGFEQDGAKLTVRDTTNLIGSLYI